MKMAKAILVTCMVSMLLACAQQVTRPGKVLVVVRDGSENLERAILKELDPMIQTLKSARLTVVLATSTGEPVTIGQASLAPDTTLEAVVVTDYDGVIIPCMASTLSMPDSIAVAVKAVEEKIPLATGDGAIRVLRDGGLLKGRRYALDPTFADSVQEGTNMGTGVVQDGLLITAGACPNDTYDKTRKDQTKELTVTFIKAVRERIRTVQAKANGT